MLSTVSGLLFWLLASTVSSAQPLVTETVADLDGDGKRERISLSDIRAGSFVLHINDKSIAGRFTMQDEPADGLQVVDIDRSDRTKEIAVHNPGPSDDDEYLIYGYDGKAIREMGRLARWPTFRGNGIVLVDNWMGFWKKREKHVLDKRRRVLRRVPQELYAVGVEAPVDQTFRIFRTRKGEQVVARLATGNNIQILACDPTGAYFAHWYLIRSTTGLMGWARLRDFQSKVSLPLAD